MREINAARARAGLRAVQLTVRLRGLARHDTLDMLRRGSFSHDGDGTSFARRIHARVRYRRVGEALALVAGRVSAQRIVAAWLRSPEHRAVLLDPAYSRIGVAGARGRIGGGRAYLVTADFSTWR